MKLADLSENYDFVSIRAGIQEFSSDFRGFIACSTPGRPRLRHWGRNRMEYNAAFFDLLEKETNSGFNRMERRDQQVWIANVYIQDFLTPGYTTSFSFHANIDQGRDVYFDHNGFLVRPAPIGFIARERGGGVLPRLGGDGHIGRLNITHAFYQAFGEDVQRDLGAAGGHQRADGRRRLSIDKDWLGIRASFFFASGDDDP